MNWATLSTCEQYHSKLNLNNNKKKNLQNECINTFLENAKLEKFSQKFIEEGFVEIGDLIDADEEILSFIGLKSTEIRRFKKYIKNIENSLSTKNVENSISTKNIEHSISSKNFNSTSTNTDQTDEFAQITNSESN